ncbi:MAG: AGE family epimerase/isomerase [Bacillota bacterium]
MTKDPRHLAAALEQLEVIKSRFLDPKFPGGIRPGFSRDFGRVVGVNNVDVFTHLFEALLALYDVTEGAKREEVAGLIKTCGDFLVKTLYRDQAGYTDRGYVAYNYTEDWRPSQEPYSRRRQWAGAMHSSPGHGVELAYLLSRAVERGFDPGWLSTAEKLMRFCLAYAFEPKTGGMLYESLDYEGRPLPGNPDNAYFLWWPQMESARALLHFAVVRGWETDAAFKKIEAFIQSRLIDQEYGGLYQQLKADTLTPDILDKGNIWKTNYHYTMFLTEALRLCAAYQTQVQSLNDRYGK